MARYRALPFGLTGQSYPLFIFLRKPADDLDFLLRFYAEVEPKISPYLKDFAYSQLFETIKNAAAHGGDALLMMRRRKILGNGYQIEVVVWDNGPGIGDIKKALTPGHSSRPDRFSDFCGMGKGMDLMICEDPPTYTASTIMIESGLDKAFRNHPSGPYHFEKVQRAVPGTKVTLRFQSKPRSALR